VVDSVAVEGVEGVVVSGFLSFFWLEIAQFFFSRWRTRRWTRRLSAT